MENLLNKSNDSPFKRLVLNSASDQVLAFDILNIVKSRDGYSFENKQQFGEQTKFVVERV